MKRLLTSRSGVMAVLVSFLAGCATRQAGDPSNYSALSSKYGIHLQFHTAALAPESVPASYSFQKADGKLGSAKAAFSDAVEMGFIGPVMGVLLPGVILSETIPSMQGAGEFYFVTAAAVVVGGVSAAGAAVAGPAVGARELIRSWKKVGSQELAVREEALHEAFVEMASQQSFQDLLLTTVEQKFPHRLVAIAPNGQPKSPTPEVDAVFEARIDELRLERKGSDEGSYFLKIKARARLLRKEDGALIYQQSLEYRSGSSLFLDWTYHDALKGVTETGYRALSDYFADLIFNPGP